jgi:tRNA-specific 2-thiouridylase
MPEKKTVQKIHLTEVNWIQGHAPTPIVGLKNSKNLGKTYMARPRYRAPLTPIMIEKVDEKSHIAEIEFLEPQYTLSSGQSLVIYDGAVCLGGGIIS